MSTDHHKEGERHEKHAVLLAMDGSENSDYAFQWYMEHLHKASHYVVMLHVPERHAFMVGPLGGTADVESITLMMKEEEQKERALLERLAQKLKDGGIGGKVKGVAGRPGEVIVAIADEEKALFVICGSRGKGTLRRTFLGSISDYVLHHSHVPVFICKHKDFHKDLGTGSPSLKHRIMNSPLFKRKNKDSQNEERTRTASESKE
ncbi:universal stress protein Sll1388-like isoform X2 [Dreissena polymorpha]|uniref:UspA domain-containing protein n=1 Tax=Dreissena polymorpha TaxID=45954 RepID=A0A9D4MN04_DREPO|nr:universal stress protein Sll1388-like isoform X2 [Dreissena polymorpha]KAH3880627.1 hypothetical protein DPMN_004546 [Dreissena polymorpha]